MHFGKPRVLVRCVAHLTLVPALQAMRIFSLLGTVFAGTDNGRCDLS